MTFSRSVQRNMTSRVLRSCLLKRHWRLFNSGIIARYESTKPNSVAMKYSNNPNRSDKDDLIRKDHTNKLMRRHKVPALQTYNKLTQHKVVEMSKKVSHNDPDTFGTMTSQPQHVAEDIPDPEDQTFKPLVNRKRLLDYIHDIRNLARQGKVKEALHVYDQLFELGVRIDSQHAFTVAISVCGKVGYTDKAFKIYKQLRDRGYNPSPATLTGLFNSCAESPFPKEALNKAGDLRDRMLHNGWQPSAITYHAMIKAFGKCGDITTAFELVDEMISNEHTISADTFSFLLMSCISNKEAGFGYAMLLLRKMEKFKIKPTEHTFNLTLRAARDCEVGPTEILTQLFSYPDLAKLTQENDKLLTSGLEGESQNNIQAEEKPGVVRTYDTNDQLQAQDDTVKSLSKVPPVKSELVGINPIQYPNDRLMLLGGAKEIITKMVKLNCKPSLKTFTLLLACLEPTVKSEMMLLDEIKALKMKPDIAFMNALIKKRCIRQDYNQAQNVLELITQNNLIPDISTFGTLALTCENTSHAKRFLKDMEVANYRVNIKILGALIGNAEHRMDFELVTYLMTVCSKLEIIPDERMLRDLENMRSKAKKILLEEESRGTENTKPGIKNRESYDYFSKIYKTWLKTMPIDLSQHPWEQYKTVRSDSDDTVVRIDQNHTS